MSADTLKNSNLTFSRIIEERKYVSNDLKGFIRENVIGYTVFVPTNSYYDIAIYCLSFEEAKKQLIENQEKHFG